LFDSNILQYKNNSSNLTKKQRYAQIAKGKWTNNKKSYAKKDVQLALHVKPGNEIWMLHDDIAAVMSDTIPPLSSALMFATKQQISIISNVFSFREWPGLRELFLECIFSHLKAQQNSFAFLDHVNAGPDWRKIYSSQYGKAACEDPKYCKISLAYKASANVPVQTHRMLLDSEAVAQAQSKLSEFTRAQ
jgi:hypothetical protein